MQNQRMGRKKLWSEYINLPLPEGAKARMDALLENGEDRLTLIRKAIDKEVERREKRSGHVPKVRPDAQSDT